ncbi:cms1 ribosomal small subunit [Dissophora globulifera]|nr:cms1 ribosomal small subunit [Dissophora globulifera]
MPKVKDSGDALEDDFQLSDTEYVSDGGEQVEDSGDDDNDNDNGDSASASIGSKRKAPEAPKKKKQQKSKKARTEENNTPLGKRTRASQIEALNDSQDRALEHLSSIEREERRIPTSAIKDVSPFALDHTLVHLESFLKFAVANWKSKLLIKDANASDSRLQDKKGKKFGKNSNNNSNASNNTQSKDPKKKPLETSTDLPKGAPVVLIVSSSGVRAVEVIRALPLFAEAAKVGKLFAKHLKIQEQAYFLDNTCTHICVGTPHRLEKLILDGSLKLDRLELVLLDCNKDAKKRTILDIQEIRVELFKMLEVNDLVEQFKSGKTQVAIF